LRRSETRFEALKRIHSALREKGLSASSDAVKAQLKNAVKDGKLFEHKIRNPGARESKGYAIFKSEENIEADILSLIPDEGISSDDLKDRSKAAFPYTQVEVGFAIEKLKLAKAIDVKPDENTGKRGVKKNLLFRQCVSTSV
jgi:hypothetical protein